MTDDPHPLDYNATLERMEPGIAPVSADITLASIAISLNRIAKTLEFMHGSGMSQQFEMRSAIQNISSAIQQHSSRVVIAK